MGTSNRQVNSKRFEQERNFLLFLARSDATRRKSSVTIEPTDYAAVYTPPSNNHIILCGPCLIWRHGLDADGYGQVFWNGSTRRAHRVVFEMTRGPIPIGKSILHLCNRRSCVQPSHLYMGSKKDNAEDRKVKTKCWPLPPHSTSKRYWEIGRECREHSWPAPPHTPTFDLLLPPEHECSFVVPAGESTKLCEVCFMAQPGSLLGAFLSSFGHLEEEDRFRRMAFGLEDRLNPE